MHHRLLTFACFISACAPLKTPPAASRPPLPTQAQRTRVTDAAGNPVVGATALAIPDKTGTPATPRRTVSGGWVTIDDLSGGASLSFSSPSGYAWLASESSAPSQVKLASDCDLVKGTLVSGDSEAKIGGASIFFTRLDEASATFATFADQGGHFSLCIPRGDYAGRMLGDTLLQPVALDTRSTPITVQTFSNTVVTTPFSSSLPHSTLAEFLRDLPRSARVIGIGEANHGTAEFLRLRSEIALRLAADGRIRGIMLEAGVGEVFALDDYVQGKPINVAAAIDKLGYWTWNTREFVEFLEQLREYNRHSRADRRVALLGFDVQNTAAIVDAIVAQSWISPKDRELLERLRDKYGSAARDLSAADLAALEDILQRTRQTTVSDLSAPEVRRALAAVALEYRVKSARGSLLEDLRFRDQGMAEVILQLLRLSPSSSVVALGHNAHVAREPTMTISTMGQYLEKSLGEAYFPVGLFSFTGEARAWNATGKLREANALSDVAAYSVEDAILDQGSQDTAFIHMKRAPDTLSSWLNIPRFVREFGSQFTGSDRDLVLRDIPRAFDALAVIKTGNATTELPAAPQQSPTP